MEEVFELEVWSQPGQQLDPDYGKLIEQQVVNKLALAHGVFVGLSNIPDQTDVINLKAAISEGELTEQGFSTFCARHNLLPQTNNAVSANRYLEFEYGVPIAWLHLPHNSQGLSFYHNLFTWAANNSFNIQCGNGVYCVNFNSLNKEPLGWQ